jgi:hypothetical protein
MNENNVKAIMWSLIAITFILMFWGMFWMMSISNSKITFEIKMDENTREYLITHDYCISISDSTAGSRTFIGDCKFLNVSVLEVK